MAEGNVGITEFRTSSPIGNSGRESFRPPKVDSQATKTSLLSRVRGTVMRRLLSEQQFKPEDYTSSRIANDILTHTKNPLRERVGRNPYANSFDKRTILSNKGQVLAMDNPNSPPYRAVGQSLEQLVRKGALGADYQDPHHGETRYYWIENPNLLREIAAQEETT